MTRDQLIARAQARGLSADAAAKAADAYLASKAPQPTSAPFGLGGDRHILEDQEARDVAAREAKFGAPLKPMEPYTTHETPAPVDRTPSPTAADRARVNIAAASQAATMPDLAGTVTNDDLTAAGARAIPPAPKPRPVQTIDLDEPQPTGGADVARRVLMAEYPDRVSQIRAMTDADIMAKYAAYRKANP